MASYGQNFDFRVPPSAVNRGGRYVLPANLSLPIGAPIEADIAAGVDGVGRQYVKVGVQGSASASGSGQGILVFEHILYLGNVDPNLTTYSDFSVAPAGAAVQMVRTGAGGAAVTLRNTVSRTFLNVRTYPGRIMVAGLGGATPTIGVGDYLAPGAGNDTSGWWQKGTSTDWLRVTEVDNTRSECVAEILL